jgi:16S rRNA (uracil1498-N3)-methyltransferase
VVEPLFISPISKDTSVGSKIKLAGSEAKHAISVRRIQVGEAVAISDGQATSVRGRVSAISKDWLEIEVSVIEAIQEPKTQIFLVQALAKGDRDELAIQASTELGVLGIIPWQSKRSVSIWKDEKKNKGQLRWQSIVTEAAKQSLRAKIPVVEPVLESHELASRLKEFDLVLVLDPKSEVSITKLGLEGISSIAVVVGPEGGISDAELELFDSAGFRIVSLGAGILRTSTAGVAVISYLQASVGQWG